MWGSTLYEIERVLWGSRQRCQVSMWRHSFVGGCCHASAVIALIMTIFISTSGLLYCDSAFCDGACASLSPKIQTQLTNAPKNKCEIAIGNCAHQIVIASHGRTVTLAPRAATTTQSVQKALEPSTPPTTVRHHARKMCTCIYTSIHSCPYACSFEASLRQDTMRHFGRSSGTPLCVCVCCCACLRHPYFSFVKAIVANICKAETKSSI